VHSRVNINSAMHNISRSRVNVNLAMHDMTDFVEHFVHSRVNVNLQCTKCTSWRT